MFHLRPNLLLILFDRYVDKFWGYVNFKVCKWTHFRDIGI